MNDKIARLIVAPLCALAAVSASADPFPPLWNDGAGAAIHFEPAAWPSEPADPLQCGHDCGDWLPYGRFQNDLADPRTQDPSNGGTAPQNYVNVSSSCIDKSYPSIYYHLYRGATEADDVIMFRWRVEQNAHTYATGPSAGNVGSTDPWSSALWTVLFDVDGDGFRDLAAHLNGSSGSPSTPVDMIAGIWGDIPTQSIDYVNDPNIRLIAHNPTGFVGPGGKLLNFRSGYPGQAPVESWPNGSAETSWDYGTTRARQVSKNSCNEYFIDYQIPVRMLDASSSGPNPALDGPKITRSTPISMIFCTANSLNNPFQKDCAINKAWSADAAQPAPFGDYLSFDKDDPYAQPIISSVTATGPGTCPGNYTLTAKVQDTLALSDGVVGHSLQAVDFFYWHDADGNGAPDEAGGQWVRITPTASLKSGTLNTWTTSWNATSLLKGAYLIGVQAVDDRTLVDDDMPVGAHDNRTFSYVTGNAQGEVYLDGAWVDFTLSGGGTIQSNFPLHSPAQDPAAPTPQENWFGNPDVVGVQVAVIDVAINACGIAPSLSKSVLPADGVLVAGQDVDFTLTVSNPADNSGAVEVSELSDVLPAGFSVKPGTSSGLFGSAEPAISGQTATWSGGPVSVAPGASATLAFTAIASGVTGAYSNIATGVSSFGSLSSNPVELAVGEARLGIRKTVDDLALEPGQSVSYTISYWNDSPVAADNVVITDTLPDGLLFVAASDGGVEAAGTVTWNLGSIASGSGPFAVTLTATVADPYPDSAAVPLVNSATIDSDQTAPAVATASSFVDVPRALLAVQKSAASALVAPTDALSYTIRYANSGTADASNVAIVDTLPAGMSFVSASAAVDGGGSHSIGAGNHVAGVVTWTIATLPAGESGVLTVNVTVDDPYTGSNPSSNSVSIDSDQTDPVSATAEVGIQSGGQVCSDFYFRSETGAVGNDGTQRLATESPVPVAGDAGTSVTVTAPGKSGGTFLEAVRFYQDPASNGEFEFSGDITSTIYIDRANGPGLNIRTQVYDYDSADGTLVQLGQNDTSFGGNTKGQLTVVTPATGSLQNGHRLLWVYSVQSDHNSNTYDVQLQFDGTVSNAISGGSTFAASGASYCATAGANLVLAKAVDRAAVTAGGSLTYTLNYANVGGSAANNVTLVDTLPAGTTFVAASGGGMHAGGTVTWNLGSLAADASGSVTVSVDVADAGTLGSTGTLVNNATIDSDETSPVAASASTTIDGAQPEAGSPLLLLTKQASSSAALPGDTVGYALTLLNAGTATSTSITVNDDLSAWPAWIGYAAGSISGGDARDDSDPTSLQWSIAALAPGESVTLGFDATVAAAGVASGLTLVDNSAVASGDGGSSNAISNIETITVSTNPKLALTKAVVASSAPDLPAPGDTLSYTLVVSNNGSGDADDVVVSDPVPDYTAYVGSPAATASQGSAEFDPIDNRMRFTVGTLAAGASATLQFSVRLVEPMPAGATAIDNTATVTSSNAASRSAAADIVAEAAPLLTLVKNGPSTLPYPAATVTSAAVASQTLFVDTSARLSIGQTIRVGGSFASITAIAGRALTLATPVTASAGAAVEATATYSLTYRNDGNADAANVVLTDTLPAGMVYVASSPVAGSAPAVGSTGSVSWTIGALPVGSNGVVQVVALPTAAGSYGNGAALADDDFCTGVVPASCSATAITDVGGLVVAKSTSTPLLGPDGGGEYPAARYSITVRNTSAGAANDVAVTDLLPPGFSYGAAVSIDNPGGSGPALSPTAGDTQPSWSGFTIAGNTTLTITFDAAVASSVGAATYDNGVAVTSSNAAVTPFDELLSPDEDVTVLDAGSGIVDGYLYRDLDASGDFDPTIDVPLAGVRMSLDSDGDGFGPYLLATDASGYFRRVLDAGTVLVTVDAGDLPAGVSLTSNINGDGTDPASVLVPPGGSARKNTGYVAAGTPLPPIAVDDSDSTAAGVAVTTDVLANDDLGTEPTAISAFTQPSNGSVVCTTTQCTYTPANGFAGSDAYTYTITDDNGLSSTATVTITVDPPGGVPVANDDSYTIDQDSGANTLDVLANDSFGSDGASNSAIVLLVAASHGTVVVDLGGTPTDPTDDAFVYTPSAGYSGSDSFVYRICDATGDCSDATVTITITAVVVPMPALTFDKSAVLADAVVANATADAGETIVYTLTASNSGETILTDVTISDPRLPILSCSPAQPATLAAGSTMVCSGSYLVRQVDIDLGSAIVNTASASGTPPSGPALSASDSASTPVSGSAPAIALVKSANLIDSVISNGTADAGETIEYTLTASNIGSATLDAVTIVDGRLGALACTPAQPATLTPGAVLVCAGSVIVSQAQVDAGQPIVNTATASGTPSGGDPVSAIDSTSTPVSGGAAAITLTKRASLDDAVDANGTADTGETIEYTLTARNTGATTLADVTILDPRLPTLSCSPAQPATLAPGAALQCSGSYAVVQADIDAQLAIANTATASGTPPSGPVVSAIDEAFVPVTEGVPAVHLRKDAVLQDELAADGEAEPGESIVYTLTATNIGGYSLANVTIDDPMLPELSCSPAAPATLAPGASLHCSGVHTVTQADVDAGATLTNTASASGEPPSGPPVTATDSTDTPVADSGEAPNPMIGVSKALASQSGSGPVDLRFVMVVRNYGNVALDEVQVTENLRQTFPSPVGFEVLSLTATGSVQVNPAFDGDGDTRLLLPATSRLDVDAEAMLTLRIRMTPNGATGPFSNVVLASGTSPQSIVVSDSSVDGMNADPDGDGNPDENGPTPIVIASGAAAPAMIPATGPLAWLLLALMMLAGSLLQASRLRVDRR